jgi:hypothetical protein
MLNKQMSVLVEFSLNKSRRKIKTSEIEFFLLEKSDSSQKSCESMIDHR